MGESRRVTSERDCSARRRQLGHRARGPPRRASGTTCGCGRAIRELVDGDARARASTRATCRTSRCRDRVTPTSDAARRARRRAVRRRSRCRRTACAPSLRAAAPSIAARRGPRQRDQGARDRLARSACRRCSREETGGGQPVVVLSGPSFALEVARGLPTAVLAASARRGGGGARAGAVPRAGAPALRQRRRRRRRDWRRAEERDRDRRRRRRGARARAQRDGRAHHARPGGDLAAGVRRRRPARDAGGPERPRRSRADLHRRSEPQPPRRASSSDAAGALDEILAGMRMVAEGVRTTGAALALGARHGIELPIAAQMAAVLDGRRSPREAVEALMGRSSGPKRTSMRPRAPRAGRRIHPWVFSTRSSSR